MEPLGFWNKMAKEGKKAALTREKKKETKETLEGQIKY